MGIPLFWRVETDPEVVVHAFRLVDGVYSDAVVVRESGVVDVPWGRVMVDLTALR